MEVLTRLLQEPILGIGVVLVFMGTLKFHQFLSENVVPETPNAEPLANSRAELEQAQREVEQAMAAKVTAQLALDQAKKTDEEAAAKLAEAAKWVEGAKGDTEKAKKALEDAQGKLNAEVARLAAAEKLRNEKREVHLHLVNYNFS